MDARTVARPYAKAAFEYACQNKQLVNWSAALAILAKVVTTPDMIALLKSPQLDTKKLADVLGDTIHQCFSDDVLKNLLVLLVIKQRLIILPELFELFEQLRATYEKTIQTQIISAYPIPIEQQDKLAIALKIRLQRNVNIDNQIEPTLLGGAIVKVGDLVIDGSVKNTLAKLLNYLSAP